MQYFVNRRGKFCVLSSLCLTHTKLSNAVLKNWELTELSWRARAESGNLGERKKKLTDVEMQQKTSVEQDLKLS